MAKTIQTKRCPQCKQFKPISQFSKDKQKKDSLRSSCKQCQNQYCRQYRLNHKPERRKYRKQHHKTIRGYLYNLWWLINRRCNNTKAHNYKWYGGRGIKVKFACFEDFYNYIKELKVDPRGLTIDRINNDGHYEKGNIRFVTQSENNRNRP